MKKIIYTLFFIGLLICLTPNVFAAERIAFLSSPSLQPLPPGVQPNISGNVNFVPEQNQVVPENFAGQTGPENSQLPESKSVKKASGNLYLPLVVFTSALALVILIFAIFRFKKIL